MCCVFVHSVGVGVGVGVREGETEREKVYMFVSTSRECASSVLGIFMCCAVVHTCMTLSVTIYDCTMNLCSFLSV